MYKNGPRNLKTLKQTVVEKIVMIQCELKERVI